MKFVLGWGGKMRMEKDLRGRSELVCTWPKGFRRKYAYQIYMEPWLHG